jgi:hypothetical protein
MTKALKALALGTLLATATAAQATPSTTFWTPATTYVQPYLVPHITYDTYFGEQGSYPVDTGLEIGFLPFEKVQGELGFDLNYGPGLTYTNGAFLLNAKLGLTEGAFGEWFPGISAGIYGVGLQTSKTKPGRNDYNILHAEIGKTFAPVGTLTVGFYTGKAEVDEATGYAFGLVDVKKDGTVKKDSTGFMGAYLSPDVAVGLPGLNKINFFADFQSGNNALGAWGAGIGLYFTPAIDILTGPIFFLNERTQPGAAKMFWTVQLDVDVELLAKPKS